MRIAKVVGNVTLSQSHPTFQNCCLRLVLPLTLEQLTTECESDLLQDSALLVAWDDLSAGVGSLVALAEGPEAAQPYYPELKPIDAAIVALLDSVDLNHAATKLLQKNN